MHPGAKLGKNRRVAAINGVEARSKHIGNLSLKHKNGGLGFAYR